MAGAALLLIGFAALAGALNARAPRRRGYVRIALSMVPAWLLTELPLHFVVGWLLAAGLLVIAGAAGTATGVVGLALVLVATVLVIPAAVRSRGYRVRIDDFPDTAPAVEYPRAHVALPFLAWVRRDVQHEYGVPYDEVDGRVLKLDVSMPRHADGPIPAIVHIHGGGMLFGSRREQGVALLGHLAANGWAGFNIDYRHSPGVTFPTHLRDIKRAIAWIRDNADRFGVDPSFIAVTGGSAGGQLCALTALTANDPTYQPGFEKADTSVGAAVPFYGIYDVVDDAALHLPLIQDALERWIIKTRRVDDPDAFARASAVTHVRADAPPFLIIHGDRDSLVPIAEARRFAERLGEASEQPVSLVELPGAQHAFDIFPSWHTIPVIEAVEQFLRFSYARRVVTLSGRPR